MGKQLDQVMFMTMSQHNFNLKDEDKHITFKMWQELSKNEYNQHYVYCRYINYLYLI